MNDKQETIADIVAEMRGLVKPGETLNNTYELLNGLADRIEAAHKREVGNGAKIREALEYVLHFDATDEAAMEDGLTDAERIAEYADHIKECQKKANAALAASARNCDRFKTKEEAAIAFANENKQWIPQQVLWELAPWLDWLFATAGVGRKE